MRDMTVTYSNGVLGLFRSQYTAVHHLCSWIGTVSNGVYNGVVTVWHGFPGRRYPSYTPT